MSEYVRITDRKIELTDEGVEAFMSDYIPTTEEVRELVQGASAEEFDRWLIAERKRVAEMAVERLFSKLTRVTLVDDDRNGIQYERYDIQVEPSIQDNGKTLKLFIKGNSPKVS